MQIIPAKLKNQDQKQNQKKKLNIIPYLLVIFFLIIFAVDISFIYIANKTWRGVVTQDSYQKGLKYNQTIKYVKKQQQLGWDSQINYVQLSERKGILKVTITDNRHKIINDAKLTAKFTRPVQEGFDFNSKLQFDSKNSLYNSPINFPLKGQWDVELQVIRGDDIYQNTKRLIIY